LEGRQYPAIREQAAEVGATIYFADEAAVRSDYHAGATWAPVGRTPVDGHPVHRSNAVKAFAASRGTPPTPRRLPGRMTRMRSCVTIALRRAPPMAGGRGCDVLRRFYGTVAFTGYRWQDTTLAAGPRMSGGGPWES
jgi:hypothetical protein